jgi:hypothetical protein
MDRTSNLRVPSEAKASFLCSLNGTAKAVPYPKTIGAEVVPHAKSICEMTSRYLALA